MDVDATLYLRMTRIINNQVHDHLDSGRVDKARAIVVEFNEAIDENLDQRHRLLNLNQEEHEYEPHV